jgi:hypothetical protein
MLKESILDFFSTPPAAQRLAPCRFLIRQSTDHVPGPASISTNNITPHAW